MNIKNIEMDMTGHKKVKVLCFPKKIDKGSRSPKGKNYLNPNILITKTCTQTHTLTHSYSNTLIHTLITSFTPYPNLLLPPFPPLLI